MPQDWSAGGAWGASSGALYSPWCSGVAGGDCLGGALGDLGMDEDFVKEVGDSVGRGHSALLALVEDDMVSGILDLAERFEAKISRTSFSKQDEELLSAIFLTTRE